MRKSNLKKNENPTIMQIINYSYEKLSSKYGKGGYAKMYFQDKKYINFLNKMQRILENKDKFIEAELQIIRDLKMDTTYINKKRK